MSGCTLYNRRLMYISKQQSKHISPSLSIYIFIIYTVHTYTRQCTHRYIHVFVYVHTHDYTSMTVYHDWAKQPRLLNLNCPPQIKSLFTGFCPYSCNSGSLPPKNRKEKGRMAQTPRRIQNVDPPSGSVIRTIGVLKSRIGGVLFFWTPL